MSAWQHAHHERAVRSSVGDHRNEDSRRMQCRLSPEAPLGQNVQLRKCLGIPDEDAFQCNAKTSRVHKNALSFN